MKYSVCTNAVFGGIALPDAIRRVAAAGFGSFEFWSWWDQDMEAVAAAKKETGLSCVGMCTRMVPLNVPQPRNEYLQGLRESISMASKLDCSMLISQVGQENADQSRRAQHDCIAAGLRECAPMLEEAGVTLVIEPLNALVNHKGYYLTHSEEAFEIIRKVNSPNVKVLFDVYHQQITEGNLISSLTENIDLVGHIHIAGVPGRHEPMDGSEISYPAIIDALKNCGYKGAIGLEYMPLRAPEAGLREILERMPL